MNKSDSSTSSALSAENAVKAWIAGGRDASNDNAISLSQAVFHFFSVIRENRLGIIILCILGCVAGVLKAVSEQPVYQARLTMAVEPNTTRGTQQSLFDPYAFRFYETQYELLKSRSVAERVVDKLDLHRRESVDDMLIAPDLLVSLRDEAAAFFGLDWLATRSVERSSPADPNEDLEAKRQWLTSVIQAGVSVSGGEKTNIVTVKFNSTNASFAAEVANALVDAYIDLGLESQLNRSQQTSIWLASRIEELKKSLAESQAKLQEFLAEEDLLGSQQSNVINSNELQVLNQEYLTARSKYDELTKRYGQKHPKIAAARADMQAARQRWQGKSKRLSSSKVQQFELAQLERSVEVNSELYEAFLTKFKEADLSTGTQVASVRVVDKALPPGSALYPNRQRIVLAWGLAGLVLGILLALLREQLDTTFKNIRSVEDKLGLPLLGVVQAMPKDVSDVERHYLENTRSVFSESINHIRTGITYSNVDQPPKTILITSSVQSEGKTTVASNLALSYAKLGPTLLIDADLRRPRIKHIVKTEHNYGLVDYVAGVVSLKECVSQDEEETNLFILNSGTTPPNPLELLSSDKMQKTLQHLHDKFSYIIIDTAPVLPASDAIVLGRMVDAVLMVIQSDRTTFHMARDAIKRLDASKVEINGLILSQANMKKGSQQYGGYYGGYYGYGAYAYVEDKDDKSS